MIIYLLLAATLATASIIAVWDRRRRLSPEWREKRFVAFLRKDLPSTCSVFGHELSDFGCRWCNDLEPHVAAKYSGGKYLYLDPDGLDIGIPQDDPRIVGFNQTHWKHPSIRATPMGIAWVDRRAPKSQYSRDLPAVGLSVEAAIQYASRHGQEAKEDEAAQQRRHRYEHAIACAPGGEDARWRRQARREARDALDSEEAGHR